MVAILTDVKGYLIVVLIFASLSWLVMLIIFSYVYQHVCVLLGEVSVQVLCPFLVVLFVCLFGVELCDFCMNFIC